MSDATGVSTREVHPRDDRRSGILFYVFLWVLALNGVSSLVAPLVIPVVLAVTGRWWRRAQPFHGHHPTSTAFPGPRRRVRAVRELQDEAVVLRTYKSGESDRIAVLWTRGYGKVRVLAKGIRKTTSRLGGTLEPLAYVRVDLVKSRGDLYITRQVQHRERLTTLRSSYARINAGYAVVEVVDAIPSDDVADEGIFELLARVLMSLDDEEFDPTLVPASFFFKLLAHDGSEPVVDRCVNCERAGPLVAFDAADGRHAVRAVPFGCFDLARSPGTRASHPGRRPRERLEAGATPGGGRGHDPRP